MQKLRNNISTVTSVSEALRMGKHHVSGIAILRHTPKAILVQLATNESHNLLTKWVGKSQVVYWPKFDAYFLSLWLLKKFGFTCEVCPKLVRPLPALLEEKVGAPFGGTKSRIIYWKELI